jgi:hypothetical protein
MPSSPAPLATLKNLKMFIFSQKKQWLPRFLSKAWNLSSPKPLYYLFGVKPRVLESCIGGTGILPVLF